MSNTTCTDITTKKSLPVPPTLSPKTATKKTKKRIISGHPSQIHHQYTFNIQKHVLQKCRTRLYLKCRIPGCNMLYVTLHSVKELNAHHHIYHRGITYQCSACKKPWPHPQPSSGTSTHMPCCYINVKSVTNLMFTRVNCDNTHVYTLSIKCSTVVLTVVKDDITTLKIWKGISLHTLDNHTNVNCATRSLIREDY